MDVQLYQFFTDILIEKKPSFVITFVEYFWRIFWKIISLNFQRSWDVTFLYPEFNKRRVQ